MRQVPTPERGPGRAAPSQPTTTLLSRVTSIGRVATGTLEPGPTVGEPWPSTEGVATTPAGRLLLSRAAWMIFCLLDHEEWESRRHRSPVIVPGPEGFVHCCDKDQIAFVRANYFPTGSTVVALSIDPTALDCETRYEPGSGGESERFPHVYGSIRRGDIVDVTVL